MTESPMGLPKRGELVKEGGDSEKSSDILRSSYSEQVLSSVSSEDSVSVTGGEEMVEEERDLGSFLSSGSSSWSKSSAAASSAINSERDFPIERFSSAFSSDSTSATTSGVEGALLGLSSCAFLRASMRETRDCGREGKAWASVLVPEGRPAFSMLSEAAATAAVLASTLDESLSLSSSAKPGLSMRDMKRFADETDDEESELEVEFLRSGWYRAAENILLVTGLELSAGLPEMTAGEERRIPEDEEDDDEEGMEG